ncbi:hypothetical protein L9F63_013493 [Diploptera punctata]|uniref:Uncharacterized protein n=1 Tax=Diploptera punctata TaxID=6984 RepID=A0AAD8A9W9_DIPPU|nr:hypothetical protein L9F63_013493 [Diploptera punctata]
MLICCHGNLTKENDCCDCHGIARPSDQMTDKKTQREEKKREDAHIEEGGPSEIPVLSVDSEENIFKLVSERLAKQTTASNCAIPRSFYSMDVQAVDMANLQQPEMSTVNDVRRYEERIEDSQARQPAKKNDNANQSNDQERK